MSEPIPPGLDARTPPSPGTVVPGDFLVDAQTRCAWLGVAVAEDPAQAILISDIVETVELINEKYDAAIAYTNTALAGKSSVGHTHVAANITNFNAAVDARIAAAPQTTFTPGMIVLWSGSLAAIGVGTLAGWALCNGVNGTPNLQNRFVLGAGSVAVGGLNPNTVATSGNSGAIAATVTGSTTLTTAMIPAHGHSVNITSGGESVSHTHAFTGTGTTDTEPAHTHTILVPQPSGGSNSVAGAGTFDISSNVATTAAGAHSHSVTVSGTTGGRSVGHTHTVVGSTGNTGGSDDHNHTVPSIPSHSHQISSAQLRDALPYWALAYIMKL